MKKQNETALMKSRNIDNDLPLVMDKPKLKTASLRKQSSTTVLVEPFMLAALPYTYDALEPHIDSMTMEIHHSKHHAAYVNNLNKAIHDITDTPLSIEEIIKNISKYSLAVRNNGGGHYNHSMFWRLMKFNGGGQPTGKLLDAINTSFGSFDNFKNKFNEAAKNIFGSGWAWLVLKNGKLEIGTTPNQDNPLMDISDFKGVPILCLDIWEHAYYLKHQNKRIDYINAWWNVVNWDEAANNLKNSNK
jgi:Fe-Mn family superoxide dismutase